MLSPLVPNCVTNLGIGAVFDECLLLVSGIVKSVAHFGKYFVLLSRTSFPMNAALLLSRLILSALPLHVSPKVHDPHGSNSLLLDKAYSHERALLTRQSMQVASKCRLFTLSTQFPSFAAESTPVDLSSVGAVPQYVNLSGVTRGWPPQSALRVIVFAAEFWIVL